MKRLALLILSLIGLVVLGGCNMDKSKPNIELIQGMMQQPAVMAQEYDDFFPGGQSSLVPPEHTVPVGFQPYKYGADVNAAEKELKNPLAGQMTAEVLSVGQKYFETHCMVCHGQKGEGKGPVQAKYPFPIPPLLSDKVRTWPDGHIYHVITMGQGVMGPYASHVPQAYRWQVVNYIRYLQKNQ
ncbi:MAG: cytochrome c [Oligoflexia bacterium]|nr:MAG: cytochrome c [Oligoflexia bacterium]